MKISIGCDHAGFELKQKILKSPVIHKFDVSDEGCFSSESVDYPDFAHKVGKKVNDKVVDFGIVICGSGNGVNMVVNKYSKVRSALCWTKEIAELARLHNNANICAIPARFISEEIAINIVDTFLNTGFEGGRHLNRINKIPISQ
ncbi:MAG: ribose 5-phosphate isomerase B [bacterium]|nr:ribose 5-phosphate isomerase B [bacterium]